MQNQIKRNNQLQPAEAAGLMAFFVLLLVLVGIAAAAIYFFGAQPVVVFVLGISVGGWLIRRSGR